MRTLRETEMTGSTDFNELGFAHPVTRGTGWRVTDMSENMVASSQFTGNFEEVRATVAARLRAARKAKAKILAAAAAKLELPAERLELHAGYIVESNSGIRFIAFSRYGPMRSQSGGKEPKEKSSGTAPTCQGAGTTCTVANGGNLPVCVATCDPLADDCAEDFGCISVDTQFVCGPMRAAPAGPGEPCSSLNDCDDGLFCAEPPLVPGCTDTLCCTHFCDLDLGDTQCEIEGTSCLPWFEPGTAPQECLADLGLCVAT